MWDEELMFSDGQAIATSAATLCLQSVDLAPLEHALGRNVGVGTPLFVEVYGYWSGIVAGGSFTFGFVTDDNEGLASATNIFTDLNLAVPTVLNVPIRLALIPVPVSPNLERYIGLQYTFSAADATHIMNVTSGVTLCPTQLRNYGNNLKIS